MEVLKLFGVIVIGLISIAIVVIIFAASAALLRDCIAEIGSQLQMEEQTWQK